MSLQKSKLGILGSLATFRRHGARGEGEGEAESSVFPCPGTIELAWGPFFPPGVMPPDKVIHPKQQIRASNFHFSAITAPWGREGAGIVGVLARREH
jgi:hypothetical protein